MNQYQKDTDNYVVGDISLGEGRYEQTNYPHGCNDKDYQQTMAGENKAGDHHEYA